MVDELKRGPKELQCDCFKETVFKEYLIYLKSILDYLAGTLNEFTKYYSSV